MAMRPCDVCRRRFPGPSNSAYVAILDGGQRWELKLRLCSVHWLKLEQLFTDVDGFINYEADTHAESQPCLVCHGDVNGAHPQSAFMTAYPARAERADYFAPVCAGCRPAAEVLFRGL